MTSRKQFIESQGATCDNWNWSWSFVNHQERFVIFGAWDINVKGNMTLIFSKTWEINNQGRKSPGFEQSSEHIQLIEKAVRTEIINVKVLRRTIADRLIEENTYKF